MPLAEQSAHLTCVHLKKCNYKKHAYTPSRLCNTLCFADKLCRLHCTSASRHSFGTDIHKPDTVWMECYKHSNLLFHVSKLHIISVCVWSFEIELISCFNKDFLYRVVLTQCLKVKLKKKKSTVVFTWRIRMLSPHYIHIVIITPTHLPQRQIRLLVCGTCCLQSQKKKKKKRREKFGEKKDARKEHRKVSNLHFHISRQFCTSRKQGLGQISCQIVILMNILKSKFPDVQDRSRRWIFSF